MNRLAAERQRIYDALAPVLPGRVHPYPAPLGSKAAPGIWIGQPTVLRSVTGNASTTLAVFPVTVAYDGTDRAQVAGLDDLVSNVWDALAALSLADVDTARPDQLDRDPAAPERVIRSAVITVEVPILARTLCLPEAEPVLIPPVVIQEAAHG